MKKRGISIIRGISKMEIKTYDYLLTIFDESDIIYNYMSDSYPFHCDFYIKSLDLYIELNAHWTHGGHPFDKDNKNDLAILNKWKHAKTRYYDAAINTWTVSDVRKRNTAKENRLNYLELFSNDMDEIIELITDKIKNLYN